MNNIIHKCDTCIFCKYEYNFPTCNKIYETDISLQTALSNSKYRVDWVRGLIFNTNITHEIYCRDRNYNGECKYYINNIKDLKMLNLDKESENKKHTCVNCEHCLRTMYISCDRFDKTNPYSYEYKCKLEAELETDYVHSNVESKIVYLDCDYYNKCGDCNNWKKKVIPDYSYDIFNTDELLNLAIDLIIFLICAHILIYFFFLL